MKVKFLGLFLFLALINVPFVIMDTSNWLNALACGFSLGLFVAVLFDNNI